MTEKRKKVLIFAYAYEPNKTSEPRVGWHFSHEIAKFSDITVVTRTNNKEAIESVEDETPINYIYYDLPQFIQKIKKRIPFGIQIYFTLWQWGAYALMKKVTQKEQPSFDLVHHLTFGMTKNVPPGYIFDIPFIWGPIGGGDLIPAKFLKNMGFGAYLTQFFYRLMHLSSNLSPLAYLTRKKSSAIIFRVSSSIDNFPKSGCQNRFLISESAMPDIDPDRAPKSIGNELNAICVGRLIHGKGYDYALKGFHNFLKNDGKGNLVFLGKGPEEGALKSYVNKNNLQRFVTFMGFVPNNTVKKKLSENHVLLHPSFREGSSWSIMEAMSFGLPVICLNTSGPKDMVKKDCGFLIDLVSPDQVISDIGKTLMHVFTDKEGYHQMSKRAIMRIQKEYNWDRRREQIKAVYQQTLA